MRVLWISSHGGNYHRNIVKGTGGWVGALQQYLIDSAKDLELGICFKHKSDSEPLIDGKVTYFPIHQKIGPSLFSKLFHRFFRNENRMRIKMILDMMSVVKSYNPDIIHIWGIENDYAEIIPLIKDVPFVVHIQGLTSAIIDSYCPPFFSLKDIFKTSSIKTFIKYGGEKMRYLEFLQRAKREKKVSMYVNNWIGRTYWDKSVSKLLNNKSTYYHCEEMMRSSFNISEKWEYHHDNKTIHIQSNISEDWYKGMDVVLKTAKLLKDKGIDIKWKIFGWERNSIILKTFVRKLDIIPEDVNVYCCGRVDAKTIGEELLKCDIYVHPSYIENSSNAIAEAQLLGVPVVAQFVGGNPTMLRDNSGYLLQANEPYLMASAIIDMVKRENSETLSKKALLVATERQNTDRIIKDLMNIYKTIIKKSK